MAENKKDEEPAEKAEEKPAEKADDAKSKDGDTDAATDDKASGSGSENSTDDAGNSTSNATGKSYNRNYRDWRAPGREDGDFGFDEPEAIETHPRYRKEMTRVLGKTKQMKKNYGYYGYGGYRGADRYGDAADLFEDDDSESQKEKEGYYPSDDEEEDETFIHDLHRHGYDGYRGRSYDGYYNAYGRRYKGAKGK